MCDVNLQVSDDSDKDDVQTSSSSQSESTVNTQKRKRNPSEWKSNKRRENCQSGKEYTSVRGKHVPAKKINFKKNCLSNCKFHCEQQITVEERECLFADYWSLSQNEKYVFLHKSTQKVETVRKTVEGTSRRHFSYIYFFDVRNEKIRVCKDFFLGTLSISQKPIYTAHSLGDAPKEDQRGRASSQTVNAEEEQGIIDVDLVPVLQNLTVVIRTLNENITRLC